jgi:hypothetical protein
MANVAQAEIVARIYLDGCGTEPSSTLTSFSDLSGGATCSTTTINGDNVSFNTATGQLTVTNAKPGRYVLDGLSFYGLGTAISSDLQARWLESTSNIASGMHYIQTMNIPGNPTTGRMPQGSWEFTNTATRIFKPQIRLGNNTNITAGRLQYTGGQSAASLVLTRFPTSSELVVTPERQNTFGGVNFNGSGFIQSQSISASTWAKLTYQTTITRNPYGKAFVETNNDISVTIKSLPVGTYRVVANGLMRAIANGSGNMTSCAFGISDSATPTNPIIASHANAVGDATSTTQDAYVSTAYGVFTNTSVQDKTFFVVSKRVQGLGTCILGTNSGDYPFVLSVEPLDQPSNSALYVQGPVLGAQTGAAIPAGYQGETLTASPASAVTPGASAAYKTVTSITLQPGIYWIRGTVDFSNISSTGGNYFETSLATTADTRGSIESRNMFGFLGSGSYFLTPQYVTVTSATTYHLIMRFDYTLLGTSTYTTNSIIRAVRIN